MWGIPWEKRPLEGRVGKEGRGACLPVSSRSQLIDIILNSQIQEAGRRSVGEEGGGWGMA